MKLLAALNDFLKPRVSACNWDLHIKANNYVNLAEDYRRICQNSPIFCGNPPLWSIDQHDISP